MAKPSIELIQLLRSAARQIAQGAPYQWGHMGSCNCGQLAQSITRKTKGEIHARAMYRHGDWDQQLRDYCPQSGLPLDEVIDEMLAMGLTRQDLRYLERLNDPRILAQMPPERRYPKHNLRDDVVLYLQAWADLIEAEWLRLVPKSYPADVISSDANMAPVPLLI